MNRPVFSVKAETAVRSAFPTVQIDAALQIVSVNDAAAKAGILPGTRFPTPLLWDAETFPLWHESLLRMPEDPSAFPGEGEPIRLRIAAFHGFHLAYVSYHYALAGNFAEAVLFHSHREYMYAAPYLSRQFARCARELEERMFQLEERCGTFLQKTEPSPEEITDTLRELMTAALFIGRVFSPVLPQRQTEKRKFRLSAVLSTYLASVLPGIHGIDCRISYSEEKEAADLLLPFDPSAMFLLLTVLFRILNDLSRETKADVSFHKYGRDGEIRFSFQINRPLPPLYHVSDLTALSALFPQKEMLFVLADYLSGMQDCSLDFSADPRTGSAVLSLFIPYEKTVPDFKSPLDEEAALRKAARCLKGILFLEEAALNER